MRWLDFGSKGIGGFGGCKYGSCVGLTCWTRATLILKGVPSLWVDLTHLLNTCVSATASSFSFDKRIFSGSICSRTFRLLRCIFVSLVDCFLVRPLEVCATESSLSSWSRQIRQFRSNATALSPQPGRLRWNSWFVSSLAPHSLHRAISVEFD